MGAFYYSLRSRDPQLLLVAAERTIDVLTEQGNRTVVARTNNRETMLKAGRRVTREELTELFKDWKECQLIGYEGVIPPLIGRVEMRGPQDSILESSKGQLAAAAEYFIA